MKIRNKKFGKRILAVMSICMLTLTCGTAAFAESKNVVYKLVDSNSYTYVDKVTKASKTSYASVKITQFYKSDGTPTTSYKKAYFQLGSDGKQASGVSCSTDSETKLTLKGTNNVKGTSLSFYAMGNNDSLDCYVDATLNADAS